MAPIETGRAYYITDAESGATLDLSREDGVSIIGRVFDGTPNQQWIIESAGEGLRTFKCARNGKYLGYSRPLQVNAAVVGVETAIKWGIVQDKEDTYRIFIPGIWLQLSLKHSVSGTSAQLSYPLSNRSQIWKIIADVTNIRIVTFNVARDSMPDKITVQDSIKALPDPLAQPKYFALQGEQPWSTRRIRIAESLLSYKIDIACFQATTIRQVNDLLELFGNDWEWLGVGSEGIYEGVLNPVFYKKSVFKLLSTDSFWLSNDPFQPSKVPSAHGFRVCTVARFSSMDSGKEFTVLNTHLDHVSDDQRKLGASMLLVRARYEAVNSSGPVFVTGTLNSRATSRSSGAYDIVIGSLAPVSAPPAFTNKYAVRFDQLPNFGMVDLRGVTPKQHVSVNYATYTGFTAPNDQAQGQWQRNSYILGGNNMGWISGRYFVGTTLSDDGVLSSFHRPVFADISI